MSIMMSTQFSCRHHNPLLQHTEETQASMTSEPSVSVALEVSDTTQLLASIASCPEDSEIILLPGVYTIDKAICFDKNITLKGRGDAENTILECNSATVIANTSKCSRLENLWLRNKVLPDLEGEQRVVIRVTSGELELEKCLITSEGGSGVFATNDASVVIKNSVIRNCISGVFALLNSSIRIEHSIIHDQKSVCVALRDATRATITQTQLLDAMAGVFVVDNSHLSLEFCLICRMKKDAHDHKRGIGLLAGGGTIVCKNTKISQCNEVGLYVLGDVNEVCAEFVSCEIFDCALNVSVQCASPIFHDCRFFSDRESQDSFSIAALDDVPINENRLNVCLDVGSTSSFFRCFFARDYNLVQIKGDTLKPSKARFAECQFTDAFNGITVEGNSEVDISDCTFTNCALIGLSLQRTSKLANVENSRFAKGAIGILLETNIYSSNELISEINCHRSTFHDISTCGVVMEYNTHSVITECVFENIEQSGVYFRDFASGKVSDCIFRSIQRAGIQIDTEKPCEIHNNQFENVGKDVFYSTTMMTD